MKYYFDSFSFGIETCENAEQVSSSLVNIDLERIYCYVINRGRKKRIR